MGLLSNKLLQYFTSIKQIGYDPIMDNYEKRRLGIFNIINFIALLTGVIVPTAALSGGGYLPPIAWVVACAPFFISLVVLLCNFKKQYKFALGCYFLLYPTITSIVYFGGIDVGIELLFILYGVLAVFFLQDNRAIIISIAFTICCYFIVYSLHGKYGYVMKEINPAFYFFIQLLSISLIFVGLLLIKKENTAFQQQLTTINKELIYTNDELNIKRLELVTKANLLEEQTENLGNLNAIKDRMFSIISHDLKNPIYSLRNLFRSVQKFNLPADEIKILVPDILNDLNYTTSLMDNLLNWAKSQMQGYSINPQPVNIKLLITETIKLLHLQMNAKEISLEECVDDAVNILADKDMVSLVLRNLISNAIKFTPIQGNIQLAATAKQELVEICIKDNGVGISAENINKLFEDNYFSTKGTSNENGTGLGLMLCKEFIAKNGGQIFVESEVGKGSKFIFTIPREIV